MADYAKLRIEIDRQWSSNDFANLFGEFELLNEMAHFAMVRFDEQTMPSFRLFRSRRTAPEWLWDFDPNLDVEAEKILDELSLRNYVRYFIQPTELQVSAVRFESPGFVDFLGIGKVIGEIRKFVLGITDRYLAVEDRELERQHKRQKILKDKLSNVEKFLKLADKSGIDPETRRQMVKRLMEADLYLEYNLIDGKITSVRELDISEK